MARLPARIRNQVLAQTRQRLLDAAILEFARVGYVGASINRISKAAGFAQGTIYNYFPSKCALMVAVIDHIAAAHTETILKQVMAETHSAQRLECFFRAGFVFVEARPAQAQIIVNVVYGPDIELKEHIYLAYAPLFRLIEQDILKAGVAQGEFQKMNCDLVTALIMAMYLGSSSQLDACGKIQLDPADVTRFILDGLRRRN